jgi:hypothetical protein
MSFYWLLTLGASLLPSAPGSPVPGNKKPATCSDGRFHLGSAASFGDQYPRASRGRRRFTAPITGCPCTLLLPIYPAGEDGTVSEITPPETSIIRPRSRCPLHLRGARRGPVPRSVPRASCCSGPQRTGRARTIPHERRGPKRDLLLKRTRCKGEWVHRSAPTNRESGASPWSDRHVRS